MTRGELLRHMLDDAGTAIRSASRTEGLASKSTAVDYVTAADLKSEEIIIAAIQKYFPDDTILSEESHKALDAIMERPHLWIIDPIDGTVNFARGRMSVAVSIAYAEEGTLKLGGIINPFTNQLWTAESGKGAHLNGEHISVSKTNLWEKALIATDTGYQPEENRKKMNRYLALDPLPRMIIPGSAAIAYAEVASGAVDLYFHNDVQPWDNAAGHLLITEAGGVIQRWDGAEATWLDAEIVCGNEDMVSLFVDAHGSSTAI